MSIAKVSEISASSTKSFDDAIEQGIKRAAKTIRNIQSAWVNEQKVRVDNDKVSEWRVNLKVSFLVEE